jgi:hypothetical protein
MRAIVALSVSLLLVLPVRAEDQLAGTRGEMTETQHSVRVVVDRGHAHMVVRRTVRSEGDRHDQAVYDLTTPAGSVAVGLRTLGMKNGHPIWYAGELMEAEAAAAKYQELTGVGGFYPKDPALLSWRGDSHLALQVFPVAPRSEKTIEYSLVLPTRYEGGHDVLVLSDLGLAGRSPTLVLETARPGDHLWLNGQPHASGVAMPWPGTVDHGGPADPLAVDASTGTGAELRIVLVRAAAAKLAGRLGAVRLSPQAGLVHFRIEAARRFSSLPRRVSMVVLVDRSYSVEPDDREAGLVAIAQVLRRLPDARVATLAFDRKVTPLWPGFVSAAEGLEQLDEVELPPANGSQVDDALRAARVLLAREPQGRERRIYLLSDLLTRSALAVPSLSKSVKGTAALLHVGMISEGEASLDPIEDTPWAKLARATGGLCWRGEAREDAVNLATVFEEWVRPTRLYRFALAGFTPGKTNRLHGDEEDGMTGDDDESGDAASASGLPAELPEGTAYEYGGLPFAQPRHLVARGELWARPIRVGLTSTADEERLWSAMVFGTSLYNDLSEREMMTLAMRGGAVSPVSSYLAIEPGVRPSTEGLEDVVGSAGGGSGEGTIGLGNFGTVGKGDFDPDQFLRKLLVEARRTCELADRPVAARIETTRHEIVDVPALTVAGSSDATCLREAIWSWQLPDAFSEERASYALSLP